MHWQKVKNKEKFKGYCSINDWKCNSDDLCPWWKGKKYVRGQSDG